MYAVRTEGVFGRGCRTPRRGLGIAGSLLACRTVVVLKSLGLTTHKPPLRQLTQSFNFTLYSSQTILRFPMPATRTSKTRPKPTSIVGKRSAFSPRVTIFEPPKDALPLLREPRTKLEDVESSDALATLSNTDDTAEPTRRRSPRKASAHVTYYEDTKDALGDIEDTVPAPRITTRSARSTKAPTSRVKAEPPSSRPTKSPSPHKHSKPLATPHPAPANWEKTLSLIREMRAKETAAVDTMGCHMAGQGEEDPKVSRLPYKWDPLPMLIP
jgi:hypothetical protein